MKAWRHTDIDQCPRCGSDLEVYTNAPVDEVFDGDDARCVECGFYSAMTADEDGVGVQDNDLEDFFIYRPPHLGFLGLMKPTPYQRPRPKTGRNEPCPCGSGLKFKKCCLEAEK